MAKTVLNINSQEQILADFASYDVYKKSCQNILYDKQTWKEAELVNVRISYEYYLQTFPSGFYIDEAKKRIIRINSEDNKLWERIKKENKKHFYENYLKEYPEGLNAQEAKTRIMDINAWERAKSFNTKESYEDYLKLENYPNGLYKIEAKKIVDEHETWETAKASNSKSLYRDYLRKYPNGLYSYQANTIISQILAKEKEDFWKGVKYSVVVAVIVFIIYAVNKEKPINNQQSQPVIDITVRNDNCWDQDYYADNKLVAKVSAHSLVNFKINPGTYTTKACTSGTSNCGTNTNSVWTRPTTQTISPHPDCIKQNTPTALSNNLTESTINNFLGIWTYTDNGSTNYLKIDKDESGRLKFFTGSTGVGDEIFWSEPWLKNTDGIYLKPLGTKLQTEFISSNFYATHGQEFTYKITLEITANNRLHYSVWSSIRNKTDEIEATKKQSINTTPTAITPSEPETLYVNTQQMILRAGAGSEYREISKIPYGDAVIATETAISMDGGNWVKVKTGNLEGWLNRKLLSTTMPVLNNLDTLSVTIGNECYCGSHGGSFEGTYSGKPITVSVSYNENEANPVSHPLVISQNGQVTNDFSLLPCQTGENKCPDAGKVVQVTGNWTGTKDFEARQLDFPKADIKAESSNNVSSIPKQFQGTWGSDDACKILAQGSRGEEIFEVTSNSIILYEAG